MPKFSKDAFFCTIFTFVISGILYFSFINLSILDPFENAFRDFKLTDIYYAERLNEVQLKKNIIIVNVKHADRFQIARAIDKIAQQQPKTIGLDIIFKDRKLAFSDSLLNQVISQYDNIVTAYYHSGDSIVNNNAYFSINESRTGYINLNLRDQNSVIRNFQGIKGNETTELAFATQLAITSGFMDKSHALKELNHPIPINYIGNRNAFLNFTIDEILSLKSIPAIKNAVVLLGYVGDGNEYYDIEDKHFTPLNDKWVGRGIPDTYGVTIHANILNMLSKANLLYKVPPAITYTIAFILCFVIVLFFMTIQKRNSLLFSLVKKFTQLVFGGLLLYAALLLLQVNVLVNIIPIILLTLFGIDMIVYYEHLIKYLNKKYKWQSRFL